MPPRKLHHLLEKLKLAAFIVSGLLELIVQLVHGPRFWWLRRTGREAEVEKIVWNKTKDWAGRILSRLRCAVEIEGAEHIPAEGPFLIMCNHQSLFDIPILMGSMGRLVGFVAKRELFRLPGFSFWMRQIHSVSLDRSDPQSAARLFRQISLRIKENGEALVVFPEGTRSKDPAGRIAAFREGSIRLATLQNIPILPVSLDGSRYLTNARLMHRTRGGGRVVRLRIAPLVTRSVHSSRERRELMEQIRRTIVSNFEANRVEWPVQEAPQQPPTLPRTVKTQDLG